MTILETRPQPDNERTGASLRARGFDVLLAPMLRFEPVPLRQHLGEDYAAVIVTSANALRAVGAQLAGSGLLDLPLFAVGDRTAAAAREAGFGTVVSADMDLIGQLQPHSPAMFVKVDMNGALQARHDREALLNKVRAALN